MATHANLNSLFSDIADAIRSKTGKTSTIIADNFPTEINNIQTMSSVDGNIINATVAAGKTVNANRWLSLNATSTETTASSNKYRNLSRAILGLSGNRFLEL